MARMQRHKSRGLRSCRARPTISSATTRPSGARMCPRMPGCSITPSILAWTWSIMATAVDAAGDAYVTGQTGSSDFPTSVGAFDTSWNGSFDAFVTKLDPAGSTLLYSTFLGGSRDDVGFGIALDAAGDAYVTGFAASSDFPTSVGALDTSQNGSDDAFVTKLNPAGSTLLYSTFLGGSGDDVGFGIA